MIEDFIEDRLYIGEIPLFDEHAGNMGTADGAAFMDHVFDDLAVDFIAVFQAAVDDLHGPVEAPLLKFTAVGKHGFVRRIDAIA